MSFRDDFVWGAASASYQIEGAHSQGGKGETVWDMFCRKKDAIYNQQSGEVACDHYHRYKEDVAAMKEMGINGYRFSLSWARILPNGIGEVNQEGIDFYNNLINELIANSIQPFITLFHWDLPIELHKKGGWLNPESPNWFEEYAKVVAQCFSDRVKSFITFNEPQCFIGLGYVSGIHAPGNRMSLSETIPMSHNVMLAHGKAVKAMREWGAKDIKLGYAPTCTYGYPETESPQDIEAARKYSFYMPHNEERWFWNATWWSDPVVLGEYPKEGLDIYGKYLPNGWEEDLKTIAQPLDFYGQNIYNGQMVKGAPGVDYIEVKRYDGFPRTGNNWPITPEAIRWCVKFLHERYKLPIYITENGMSCHDAISLDGKVHDPNRIDFLNRYLIELGKAADDGAEVLGYFYWSLTDNFEWASGFLERFGLVFVDYTTQKRIIKDSGHWYRTIIQSNGDRL